MVRPGHCHNCGAPTTTPNEAFCDTCRQYRRCTRCYRHLPDRQYPDADSNVCEACLRRDPSNVGRYCLDSVIGDRTWRGTAQDINVDNFVRQYERDIAITFETARNENDVIKYFFEMEVEFYRTGPEETDIQFTTARFYVPPMTTDVDELNLSDIIAQFANKIESFSGQNSGWIISQIKYLHFCWGCYRPLMAGTYIPTPKWLSVKRAVVNVQSTDDLNCFQYSVLTGMNVIKCCGPHDKKCRPSQYKPYLHLLNMNGIQSPVALSAINQFEKQNPEICVNVLYLDDEHQFVPIRTSKFCNQRKHHVILLMLTDQDKFHYTSVQSLSRLVSGRRSIGIRRTFVSTVCIHLLMKMF